MKADAVVPDPFDRRSESAAAALHNHSFYSADFLSVLKEQARPGQRIRAASPLRPQLSDDARHAPTLAAGAIACVLVAGIAGAFWIALFAGMAPLDGKPRSPHGAIAQAPLGIADPQAGDRAALPAGIALLSGRDALSTGSALQAWLDATLLLAYSPAQLGIVTAARLATPPATTLAAPALENAILSREHEAAPSSGIVPGSDVQLSVAADQPPALPASARVRGDARPEERKGGNENGKHARATPMPLSLTTASHPAPADHSSSAPDIAPPTARDVTEGSPPDEGSDAAAPSASGVSPSNRAKSSAERTDGQGGHASADASAKSSDATGNKGLASSGAKSAGRAGGSESSDQNGGSERDGLSGDGNVADRSGSGHARGGEGKSEGHKSQGDAGESSKGHGHKGKGEGGEGSAGHGDKGKGEGSEGSKGSGDKGKSAGSEGGKGAGDKGKGAGSAGSKGAGDKGKGDAGKGKGDGAKGNKGNGGKGPR
jgi:hypothetical protein